MFPVSAAPLRLQGLCWGNCEAWFHKLPPKTERWQLRFSNMRCPQCPLWLGPMEAQCPPVPCLPLPPCFPCCFVIAVIVKTHSRPSSVFSGRLREREHAHWVAHIAVPWGSIPGLGNWGDRQSSVTSHHTRTHARTHTHARRTLSGTRTSPCL